MGNIPGFGIGTNVAVLIYRILIGSDLMANMMFNGCDVVELARKHGTPLYVMDENHIMDRIREIREDFLERHPDTRAVYASKAFLTKEMARIVKREGIGMDVVSGGELYTALKVDFPMEKIVFHGNNKSQDEIDMAVENGVGRIVIDHIQEIQMVDRAARERGTCAKVIFRISPGIDSHTHKYIMTGQVDSKFGIPLTDETIKRAMAKIEEAENVELMGFHFHIGSQLMERDTHIMAVDVMFKLMRDLRDQYGFVTKELNTGGGYGIEYGHGQKRKPLSYYTDAIVEEVALNSEEYGLEKPVITIEPGRWVVGEAGITLYSVGAIKEIPGIRTYMSIDGGMPDNPRPSLYEAQYKGVIANKVGMERTERVTVAGKCCESGDILIWDLMVPKVQRGDILAVMSTGAYNYSMSSNYNRIPRPSVVMVRDGVDRVIVKRETLDDLLRNDM
jgi:diaminopimelate decarboxylase